MSAPTFKEYDRHLAEFEAGRKVWLRTADSESDPIARGLALRIAKHIEDYSRTVRAYLANAREQRTALRPVDCRIKP